MNLLLRGILSKTWAIQTEYVDAHLPLIVNLLQSGALDEQISDSFKSQAYVVQASRGVNLIANKKVMQQASKGSVAVIEVNGPLMKHDQLCGPVGTATIGSWIQDANANPNIDGIVLKTDCPGSTVDGMEELARVISASKKPIVGFIDGIAASGGYWMASQCSQIIASGKTSQVGCIGVMAQLADYTEALAAKGIKIHEVYASGSTHKNKVERDALAGEYQGLVSELDKINEVFHATVRSGRPNVKDSALTGKTYFAQEAKRLGLIDKIGTLDDAIAAAANQSKKTNAMSTNTNTTLTQYPHLCAALGWADGFESTDEGVHLSTESLDALEASLAGNSILAQHNSNLNAERQALVDAARLAQGQVATLTTERDNLQQQLDALGRKPAHSGSTAAPVAGGAAEAEAPADAKPRYVDDGTLATAKKYGMRTDHWNMG